MIMWLLVLYVEPVLILFDYLTKLLTVVMLKCTAFVKF